MNFENKSNCWIVVVSKSFMLGLVFSSIPNFGYAEIVSPENKNADDWNIMLGAGMEYKPKYYGAHDYGVIPIPVAEAIYKDAYFFGSKGVGINVINENGFKAGPLIGFSMGRSHSDDQYLENMGNISAAITGGVFASYDINKFKFSTKIMQAITHDNQGMLMSLNARYKIPIIARKFELEFGPNVELANSSYNNTFFGVSQEQSTESGYAQYHLNNSISDYGASVYFNYHFNDHVLIDVFSEFKTYTNDIADSPLVQDRTEITNGLIAIYRF